MNILGGKKRNRNLEGHNTRMLRSLLHLRNKNLNTTNTNTNSYMLKLAFDFALIIVYT